MLGNWGNAQIGFLQRFDTPTICEPEIDNSENKIPLSLKDCIKQDISPPSWFSQVTWDCYPVPPENAALDSDKVNRYSIRV